MTTVENASMKVSNPLAIEFEEASSAGYLWSATEATGHIQITKTTKSPRPGITGFPVVEFSLVADVPGTYEVDFVHKRPWEEDSLQAARYVLDVQP